MNYELTLCFLFILLFIVYFYIKKQPILEGAGKSKKKDPFNAINKNLKKTGDKITKSLKKAILGPILKMANQVKAFFVNLAKYNEDWVKLIGNSFQCAFTNVTDPFCLLINLVRLFGLILYGFGWIVLSIFDKQDFYECGIIKIQSFLWTFVPSMLKKKLNKCYGKCDGQIPVWGGKKKKRDKSASIPKKCREGNRADPANYMIVSVFNLALIGLIFSGLFFFFKGTTEGTMTEGPPIKGMMTEGLPIKGTMTEGTSTNGFLKNITESFKTFTPQKPA